MSSEIKKCVQCQTDFTIQDEDFDFYKKIEVPPPTLCPKCRMIRRFMFRNERAWYRRKCDATGKDILSTIAPDQPYKVYVHEYYRSDEWDPLEYSRDYDAARSFFDQFNELFREIPHPNLVQKNHVNSEYANYTLNLKNCYFAASADTAEDCMYIFGTVLRATRSMDLHQSTDSEFCYELVDCAKSHNLHYAQNCEGCSDSALLYDCRNCTNCFGCVGLRSQQYHIFNQPYSKDDYKKELARLNLGSYANFQKNLEKFQKLKLETPRKYAMILNSEDALGDDITNSRHCYQAFSAHDNSENVRYSFRTVASRDIFDGYVSWNGAELLYETMSTSAQRVLFSALIWGGFDIQYSYNCYDCNNVFGCIGLRNKSYCILNKQYSEDEYRALLPKIIKKMTTDGEYGEFFPPSISPFAYNETVAQEYFPSTKEAVTKLGYSWREPERKTYTITKSVTDLSDHINEVDDSILNEVIGCEHAGKCEERCATAFKIMPDELQFYRRANLPLPRICPSCRHFGRLKLKNPMQLWHRKCQCDGINSSNETYKNTVKHFHGAKSCPNEFETSYSSERKEVVYCETCYNSEVV
jgi:hypothetical protein